MQIQPREITAQFDRILAAGWLKFFNEAAQAAGTSTAHILAVGSRETNLKNIRGDYRGGIYHGFGVMQVDIETDPEYCRNWNSTNVAHGITRGGEIYHSKTIDTLKCVGKKTLVRNRSFVGEKVAPDDLRRIATAAYNCGRWAHYHFSEGENIDSTTTGHDYSRDVYDRSVFFAALLENREIFVEKSSEKLTVISRRKTFGLEPNALKNEIVLQGKYARGIHKTVAGIYYADRISLPAGAAMESQDALAAATYERTRLSISNQAQSDADSGSSASPPPDESADDANSSEQSANHSSSALPGPAENSKTDASDEQKICKERPSTFVRWFIAVKTAFGAFLALMGSYFGFDDIKTVLMEKAGQLDAQSLELIVFLLIKMAIIVGAGVFLVWLGTWLYDKAANRANGLNMQKLFGAQDKAKITTDFKS